MSRLGRNFCSQVLQNIKVNTLHQTFAAEVTGLHFTSKLPRNVRHVLFDLLLEHKVLILRDQHLNEDETESLASCFGTDLIPCNGKGDLLQVLDSGERKGAAHFGSDFWHSDNSYNDTPAACTLLYAQILPETGGDTLFVDMVDALNTLPKELLAELEDLQAYHNVAQMAPNKPENFEQYTPSDLHAMHNVIRTHPHTKEKSLYVNPGYVVELDCYPGSEELLHRLYKHSFNTKRHYKHKWKPHDVVVWDNCQVAHKSTTLDLEEGAKRLHWRISILGET